MRFNIETKLSPDAPAHSPDADTFARLAVEAIREAGLGRRATIQSFDWRSLLAAKKLAPEIETVCLTYDKTLQDRSESGSRRSSAWLAGLDPLPWCSVRTTAAVRDVVPYFASFRRRRGQAQVGLKVVWTVTPATT